MRIPPRQYHAARRLARMIRIPVRDIWSVLEIGPSKLYYEWEIPKSGGGVRRISSPLEPLMSIQRRIDQELFARARVSTIAHGFIPKRSIATNPKAHFRSRSMFSVDLKDAFGT